MKRLLSKKGMTLVELIVVIAIIAILMAIVIPIFSTSSSYEKEARENARAFYSNVQQILVEEKFKDTKFSSDGSDAKYTIVYVVVNNEESNIDDRITVYVSCQNDDSKITHLTSGEGFSVKFDTFDSDFRKINTADKSDTLYEFGNSLKKLLSSNNDNCFYYAVIDSKYRVASAYFSRHARYEDLKEGNNFSKDVRVTTSSEEFIVGAYPYSLCLEGEDIFRDPNEQATG
ncbi:MAG: prepilin-type N-terminal cleavage/methylation domain-containing protein [Ruminococcaceae bacterium]|nr:prepilin-type N-terminal cleavage/methylation domain-containing protein [Oscillospiraceae bacterium]